jgi:GT2 family glycosyltransferase
MNTTEKIGVGIVTCNREGFFKKCLDSIPRDLIDELVVVNDGNPLSEIPEDVKYFHNIENLGVGKSKNILLKKLLEKNTHIFIIEDDIFVKDPDVFTQYIKTAKEFGILHLLFGFHGPANRKDYQSHNPPYYRLKIESENCNVIYNECCVGAFCYYHKDCLAAIGLIDEEFYNAFEHVEHSYRACLANYCGKYWYWPDIDKSWEYLDEAACSEESSSIKTKDSGSNAKWEENILKSIVHFKKKHGVTPAWIEPMIQDPPMEDVIDQIKKTKKQNYGKI